MRMFVGAGVALGVAVGVGVAAGLWAWSRGVARQRRRMGRSFMGFEFAWWTPNFQH
jgi:hypothetical protein